MNTDDGTDLQRVVVWDEFKLGARTMEPSAINFGICMS